MKRRILVRIVLVLILLLALYPLTKFVILPLFDTSGELEGHDVPLYGYSEPDTPMVMENDALRLSLTRRRPTSPSPTSAPGTSGCPRLITRTATRLPCRWKRTS